MKSSSDGAPGVAADSAEGPCPPAPRQWTAVWGSRGRLGACGNAGGWERRVQCRAGSAETLHFVHSSVPGGHFSNFFPVMLLDPQNAHLGLEKHTSSGPSTLLLRLFQC